MKNRIVFYSLILVPLGLLIYFSESLGAIWFSILLIIYGGVYRPLIDGLRLKAVSSISTWKTFIPFWELKYFRQIYLS
jgi:hypothetical protein